MKSFIIAIQRHHVKSYFVPSISQLRGWALLTLKRHVKKAEITIRITNCLEMTTLNETWRNKKGPTNVLSFPLSIPQKNEEKPFVGDIVLCAEIVLKEAKLQNKTNEAHYAHMVVHGILHLIGFNHEKENEAREMESEEIHILQQLGFNNPYFSNKK